MNTLDTLRAELAEQPGGILETVAQRHGVSLQAVTECLPPGMCRRAGGEHFVAALQDIASWGDVTVVVHTPDIVFEVHAPLPGGTLGHGFYNLHGERNPISGHLRAENCAAILFLRRPFMGKPTLSVQFFNAQGAAMFKVFVGRDENRQLKADQVERFAQLEARLA